MSSKLKFLIILCFIVGFGLSINRNYALASTGACVCNGACQAVALPTCDAGGCIDSGFNDCLTYSAAVAAAAAGPLPAAGGTESSGGTESPGGTGDTKIEPPIPLTNPLTGKSDTPDINLIIGKAINGALGLVGSIALVMFIYGGFTWMLAAGSPQRVTKGKDILVWATIGLAVIFSAYGLVNFIFVYVLGAPAP